MSMAPIEWQKCDACWGTGKVEFSLPIGFKGIPEARCSTCHGRGRLPLDHSRYRTCGQCDGVSILVWGSEDPADVVRCPDCGEGGRVDAMHCTRCGGGMYLLGSTGAPVTAAECHYCNGWGIVLRDRDDDLGELTKDLRRHPDSA
jgi:hypothetical protein